MLMSIPSNVWLDHMSLIHCNRQRVHVQKRTRGNCLTERSTSGNLYNLCSFQRKVRAWNDANDILVKWKVKCRYTVRSDWLMRQNWLWHLGFLSLQRRSKRLMVLNVNGIFPAWGTSLSQWWTSFDRHQNFKKCFGWSKSMKPLKALI